MNKKNYLNRARFKASLMKRRKNKSRFHALFSTQSIFQSFYNVGKDKNYFKRSHLYLGRTNVLSFINVWSGFNKK